MADGFSVEIIEQPPGSLNLFSGGLLAEQVFEVVKRSMDAIGAHIAERAQANAPIGTRPMSPAPGSLRRSIRHKVKTKGAVVEALVLASESYALRMHEELTPAGPLQLGPTSREQPSTPEGGVGGRFISRVVDFHALFYQNYIDEQLKRNLPNAVSRTVSVKRITRGIS